MSRRAFHIPLAALTLLTSGASLGGRHQASSSLRIELLSRYPRDVRVSLTGVRPVEPLDTILKPSAVLQIADWVRGIHVVVTGFGSVRLILKDTMMPSQDSLVSEGRDITLSRDGTGRFRRIWTVQPLVP